MFWLIIIISGLFLCFMGSWALCRFIVIYFLFQTFKHQGINKVLWYLGAEHRLFLTFVSATAIVTALTQRCRESQFSFITSLCVTIFLHAKISQLLYCSCITLCQPVERAPSKEAHTVASTPVGLLSLSVFFSYSVTNLISLNRFFF